MKLSTTLILVLEGCWRGVNYLVNSTDNHESIKFKVLDVAKEELLADFNKSVVFDQSFLFKKIYEDEFGTYGGTPYACLVGDFYFSRSPKDIELLNYLSGVSAAAHAPFISGVSSQLFDLSSFKDIHVPSDLSMTFDSHEMLKWNNFRNSPDSRYVSLTLPKVMARAPYSSDSGAASGIAFEEIIDGDNDKQFCWMNASYALASKLVVAFEKHHWTTAIRGVEGGGLVEDLPVFTYQGKNGATVLKTPLEVSITDRRERELADLGFMSLCNCKDEDYAAFFSCQTVHKSKNYDNNDASGNSKLSSRLSYMLAASRFAHYLKVIMRDKIGSFESKEGIEHQLNSWISQYVLLNDSSS